MTFLRLAIEARRLDLAAYLILHSAAQVLAQQPAAKPPREDAKGRKEERSLARRTHQERR